MIGRSPLCDKCGGRVALADRAGIAVQDPAVMETRSPSGGEAFHAVARTVIERVLAVLAVAFEADADILTHREWYLLLGKRTEIFGVDAGELIHHVACLHLLAGFERPDIAVKPQALHRRYSG